jgi:hypothetical protein
MGDDDLPGMSELRDSLRENGVTNPMVSKEIVSKLKQNGASGVKYSGEKAKNYSDGVMRIVYGVMLVGESVLFTYHAINSMGMWCKGLEYITSYGSSAYSSEPALRSAIVDIDSKPLQPKKPIQHQRKFIKMPVRGDAVILYSLLSAIMTAVSMYAIITGIKLVYDNYDYDVVME